MLFLSDNAIGTHLRYMYNTHTHTHRLLITFRMWIKLKFLVQNAVKNKRLLNKDSNRKEWRNIIIKADRSENSVEESFEHLSKTWKGMRKTVEGWNQSKKQGPKSQRRKKSSKKDA